MRTLLTLAFLSVAGAATAADEIRLADMKIKVGADLPADVAGYNEGDGKLFFYVNGSATGEYDAKEAGAAKLKIEASCDEANGEKAKIKVTVNGKVVAKEFELKEAGQKEYEFAVELKKGKNEVVVEFLNDKYKENEYDLNFYLHAVKVAK